MKIAGDNGNLPSWVADWPHCCDFLGDRCDDLRWSAMPLEPKNRRKTAHFIARCGRAYTYTYITWYHRSLSSAQKSVAISEFPSMLRFSCPWLTDLNIRSLVLIMIPWKKTHTFYCAINIYFREEVKIPHRKMTKTGWETLVTCLWNVCDRSQKAICNMCCGYRITM